MCECEVAEVAPRVNTNDADGAADADGDGDWWAASPGGAGQEEKPSLVAVSRGTCGYEDDIDVDNNVLVDG